MIKDQFIDGYKDLFSTLNKSVSTAQAERIFATLEFVKIDGSVFLDVVDIFAKAGDKYFTWGSFLRVCEEKQGTANGDCPNCENGKRVAVIYKGHKEETYYKNTEDFIKCAAGREHTYKYFVDCECKKRGGRS